uniref:Uncharacterized protein n=1 Tax=Meloidogyne javanica TaxID=6303 RepID=A0A915ME33_MELJA
MEVEESDNMQLEEGEVQPEQGSAPQKERQKGIRIPKVPGRNIPSNQQMVDYHKGGFIPLGGKKNRPITKFNSPGKPLQHSATFPYSKDTEKQYVRRAMPFGGGEFNSPGKPLQKSASFSYSKTSEKQSERRAMQFGGGASNSPRKELKQSASFPKNREGKIIRRASSSAGEGSRHHPQAKEEPEEGEIMEEDEPQDGEFFDWRCYKKFICNQNDHEINYLEHPSNFKNDEHSSEDEEWDGSKKTRSMTDFYPKKF